MRVLILGGTAEAAHLADALAARGVDGMLSFAGLTNRIVDTELPIRLGGFGGAAGLADYLRFGGYSHVVDATHPFAAQISAHAVTAAALTALPLIRLQRPAWPPRDTWQTVPDLTAAATILPRAARAFLAVGAQSLGPFAARPDLWCLTRSIQPPKTPVSGISILARPPFTLASEIALMRQYEITHLVTKNAGGDQTAAKLDAASALGIAVVMVARPVLPPAPEVDSVVAALAALELL